MWHMDKTPLYFDMPFKGTIDTKVGDAFSI
jgi:hypothetical protein